MRVYYCWTYYIPVCGGGKGTVEDMCYDVHNVTSAVTVLRVEKVLVVIHEVLRFANPWQIATGVLCAEGLKVTLSYV